MVLEKEGDSMVGFVAPQTEWGKRLQAWGIVMFWAIRLVVAHSVSLFDK